MNGQIGDRANLRHYRTNFNIIMHDHHYGM
jgi:hypothetical protein